MFIFGKYDIKKIKLNKSIRILNYFEEVERENKNSYLNEINGVKNEEELKENCEI